MAAEEGPATKKEREAYRKIADDIFAGGVTIDEAIDNWIRIMKILRNNNLKIALNKTVLFPKQVDVLSWVWKEGGYLSPSPHRKLALQKVNFEDIKTVKDLRSYIGLYKTFIDCTPNLTIHLDKFDQLVGSKQSNDDITWNIYRFTVIYLTYMKVV